MLLALRHPGAGLGDASVAEGYQQQAEGLVPLQKTPARASRPPTNKSAPTFCHQADLAGKDFTAEKEHVIVISTGAVAPVDHERLAAERKEAEDRNRHR